MAGIFALLNDVRLAKGLSPLGFVNPLLYKSGGLSSAFNDITDGSNPGCTTPGWNVSHCLECLLYDDAECPIILGYNRMGS